MFNRSCLKGSCLIDHVGVKMNLDLICLNKLMALQLQLWDSDVKARWSGGKRWPAAMKVISIWMKRIEGSRRRGQSYVGVSKGDPRLARGGVAR